MSQQFNDAEFTLRCPECYGDDHVAYSLKEFCGQVLRHCRGCGNLFYQSRGVELRELEPVEPPSLSEGIYTERLEA